jgi:uncharacterized delta-60 repeat protein
MANEDDRAVALVVDNTGNVYVTGSIFDYYDHYDYVTIKYTPTGIQEWVAIYKGQGNWNDFATALAIDGAGNVYVTGVSWNGTNNDYATVKYNSAGTRQWVATYNGPANRHDQAAAIAIDPTGDETNIYVTGRSWDGKNSDYVTVKYNSAGNQEWATTYNWRGNVNYNLQALAVDRAGNVYVMGSRRRIGSTTFNNVTLKYNSAGALQWVRKYNGLGNGDDRAAALAVDHGGNVYVTGGSWNGTNHDYATVQYDSAGTRKWIRTYNGSGNGNDRAVALGVDAVGNIYVTGYSANGDYYTSYDYTTVKYNSLGSRKWVKTYKASRSSDHGPLALGIDAAGNIYAAGSQSDTC